MCDQLSPHLSTVKYEVQCIVGLLHSSVEYLTFRCLQVRAGVRCSGVDGLSTADVCLVSLAGTCPAASTGCYSGASCVVSGSASHCGRCPPGSYGNGSVCERKSMKSSSLR